MQNTDRPYGNGNVFAATIFLDRCPLHGRHVGQDSLGKKTGITLVGLGFVKRRAQHEFQEILIFLRKTQHRGQRLFSLRLRRRPWLRGCVAGHGDYWREKQTNPLWPIRQAEKSRASWKPSRIVRCCPFIDQGAPPVMPRHFLRALEQIPGPVYKTDKSKISTLPCTT